MSIVISHNNFKYLAIWVKLFDDLIKSFNNWMFNFKFYFFFLVLVTLILSTYSFTYPKTENFLRFVTKKHPVWLTRLLSCNSSGSLTVTLIIHPPRGIFQFGSLMTKSK